MKQIHQENPWILPKAEDTLINFFLKHGNVADVKASEIIVPIDDYINKFVYVVGGLVSQNIVNYALNKPIAMALGFAGTYFGYRQYFTRRRSRCYLESLRKSKIITLAYDKAERIIDGDVGILKTLMKGCLRSVESDLEGMIAMFALPPEKRLKGLISCLFEKMHSDMSGEWVEIPYKLKYEEISKIIYVTKLTVERIYSAWKKEGVYKKENGHYYIRKDFMDDVEDWTEELT